MVTSNKRSLLHTRTVVAEEAGLFQHHPIGITSKNYSGVRERVWDSS